MKLSLWLVAGAAAATALAGGVLSLEGNDGVRPPYPPSESLRIHFELDTISTRAPGNGVAAPGSDNWAITWAADGHQYTTWGDGGGFGGNNRRGRVSMGVARIEGALANYTAHNVWGGHGAEHEATFTGKSYGILALRGVLYMWRTGDGSGGSAYELQDLYRSNDSGASWKRTGVSFKKRHFGKSGVFALTFLQFGQDYADARDEYVYVYAPLQHDEDWEVQIPGQIVLLRVPAGAIEKRRAYEIYAGTSSSGDPVWSSDLRDYRAVFEDPANGVMRTSVSYLPAVPSYVLITQQVSRLRDKNGHIGIYEAPAPWGPWRTVLLENPWTLGLQNGGKTVYWNFSNKWTADQTDRFVLVYTGPGADEWGTIRGCFLPPDQPQCRPIS